MDLFLVACEVSFCVAYLGSCGGTENISLVQSTSSFKCLYEISCPVKFNY